MWHSTELLAHALVEGLTDAGVEAQLHHLRSTHYSNIVTEVLDAGLLMIGSPTLNNGMFPIAGCDEAGRGPLAGPVVAAAVILDPARIPRGLNDSKKLGAEVREALYEKICASAQVAVAFGAAGILPFAFVHVDDVDGAVYHVIARHLAEDGRLLGLRFLPDYWPRSTESRTGR